MLRNQLYCRTLTHQDQQTRQLTWRKLCKSCWTSWMRKWSLKKSKMSRYKSSRVRSSKRWQQPRMHQRQVAEGKVWARDSQLKHSKGCRRLWSRAKMTKTQMRARWRSSRCKLPQHLKKETRKRLRWWLRVASGRAQGEGARELPGKQVWQTMQTQHSKTTQLTNRIRWIKDLSDPQRREDRIETTRGDYDVCQFLYLR